ncbi:MAG: FAD-binding protein [Planctomycetaceae bacterium]|nr:FAD-binding protein [Planctomycetaceae bacterium]
MLDPKRERIQDDLRGLIEGEVFANSIETQVYATDGSLFEVTPICVVCPRTKMDIVAVIRYARKHGLTVHPRGSGSSTVGAALGEGIILDMSRFMRRLLFYQPEENLINVQAGMLCSRLNEILRPHGRQLLPGIGASCPNTVGGLLSVDGYAGRWLSFGRLSDWLVELEMVTANGNILTFSNQETVPETSEGNDWEESIPKGGKSAVHRFMLRDSVRRSGGGRRSETGMGTERNSHSVFEKASYSKEGNVSGRNAGDSVDDSLKNLTENMAGNAVSSEEIRVLEMPEFRAETFQNPQAEKRWILRAVKKILDAQRAEQSESNSLRVIDKMGYRTNIQNGEKLNMARLIAGSEGTLGVITSVKLQLPEIPKLQKTLLILFDSMEKAMQAVPLLLPFHPDACELLDRRYLHLATERDVRFDAMFPPQTEALLLVELSDDSQFKFMNRIRSLSEQLIRRKSLAFQLVTSIDETEANFFRELVSSFEPSIQFGRGKPVRNTLVEDAAVSPGKLHEFFLRIQKLLRQHELTAAFHAHAIQGQVRLQPLADLHSSDDAVRVLRFARDYCQLVREMNGTIGTENGLGMGWRFWMPLFEREKYLSTNRIKRTFDPNVLFQPGKMGTEISAEPQAPELYWRRSIRSETPFDLKKGQKEDEGNQPKVQSGGSLEKNILRENEEAVLAAAPVPKEVPSESNFSLEHDHEKESVSSDEISLENEAEAKQSSSCSESGIMVLEQVRAILGNTFEDLTESGYGSVGIEEGSSWPGEDSFESLTHLGLNWSPEKIRKISSRCHGCGKCRGTDILNRACPVFRYDCSEFSSPRAKANLMEGFVNEILDVAELGDEVCRSIFHRCIQCHSCRVECRGGVDIPFLVRCAEESWAKARGLNFYETTLVRIDRWIDRFQRVPWLMNWFFSVGFFRWVMEKSFGIARKRQIPQIEARSFLERIRKDPSLLRLNPFENLIDEDPVFYETATEIQGRAVYFLDTYANHFETEIAEAAVRIFQHNRMSILVPYHQDGSGITAVMLGRSDFVRKQVYRNAAMLADYVRQGYDVLVTEPTAALAFRWEYPQTYPENEDIQLIAKHCFDVGEYLRKLHINQLLRLPKREMAFRVGYHLPCRLRALRIGTPFVHLLRLIPGLEIVQSPYGCCGMGGFHGMEAENFNSSMKIARPLHLWFRDPSIQFGTTECSACKMQMLQNSSKPVFHPVQILAYAYGLLENEALAHSVGNEEF